MMLDVTAVTMGMMLAAEPAEADIMSRPPRRPGKRLLGKLILWRCCFVSILLVVCVLGMYEWGALTGQNVHHRRAEAFNTLVFGEIAYSVTTRYIKASCVHPRVLRGNPLALVSIGVTAALQVRFVWRLGLRAIDQATLVAVQQLDRVTQQQQQQPLPQDAHSDP